LRWFFPSRQESSAEGERKSRIPVADEIIIIIIIITLILIS
jgi:hypothetical protein